MKNNTRYQQSIKGIWYPPDKATRVIAVFMILTLVALATEFVYKTGGIKYVYSHSMYLPILLGAFFFNAPGGIITGIIGGYLLGPNMPINITTGEMQLPINWTFRIMMFAIVGGVSGWLFSSIGKQLEKIRWIAFHNLDTGLKNQASFVYQIEKLASENGEKSRFAVITMTINNYHSIFNILDVHQSNQLMIKITERLGNLPFSVPVFHLLSNILGAVYPITDDDTYCDKIIAMLLDEVSKPFMINNIPIFVDLTIGAAIFPDHGENIDSLVRRSKIASHLAHDRSRSYQIYDILEDRISRESTKLLSNIPIALEKDQFDLHFQPVISLHDDSLVGFEVLLRWEHPTLGNIPPMDYLPIVERTNLIHSIHDCVLEKSLTNFAELRNQGFDGFVSINLSIRSLQDFSWLSKYEKLMIDYSLEAGKVMFEVTETSIIQDFDEAKKFLDHLKKFGNKIALDDFGAGYSSLEYIKNLSISYLKIDRKFANDLINSPKDQEIIRAILRMAEALNLKVITEGVEQQSAYDWLKAERCDYVQGFYITEPLPFDKVVSWMRAYNPAGSRS